MSQSVTAVGRFPVSRTELAQLLNTSPDMISKYIAEGLPVLVTGNGRSRRTMLDLADVLPWILSRKTGSGEEARTRRDNETADKLALANAVTRGELVKVGVVAAEFADIASNVKARLRRIPDAVSARVAKSKDPHAIKAMLRREIDDALTELARTVPTTAVPVEDEGEDEE
jgi:phage terminase Nu1 subunit (DNA packaging protein)